MSQQYPFNATPYKTALFVYRTASPGHVFKCRCGQTLQRGEFGITCEEGKHQLVVYCYGDTAEEAYARPGHISRVTGLDLQMEYLRDIIESDTREYGRFYPDGYEVVHDHQPTAGACVGEQVRDLGPQAFEQLMRARQVPGEPGKAALERRERALTLIRRAGVAFADSAAPAR